VAGVAVRATAPRLKTDPIDSVDSATIAIGAYRCSLDTLRFNATWTAGAGRPGVRQSMVNIAGKFKQGRNGRWIATITSEQVAH
jgi:hypothetical protein